MSTASKNLTELEKVMEYAFSDPALLELALTHSSVQKKKSNNERLEFLGDRVLGLAVAEMLYRMFPAENEGHLAKRHTALVQQSALAQVAQVLMLAAYIRLSAAEVRAGGLQKETILADAVEAIIGAIYLDGGIVAAKTFVEKHWAPQLHKDEAPPQDPKTHLQEWAQGKSLPLPEYNVVTKSGSEHAPQFEIEVSIRNHGKVRAKAASKRAAEKAAASAMLEKIGEKVHGRK